MWSGNVAWSMVLAFDRAGTRGTAPATGQRPANRQAGETLAVPNTWLLLSRE